MSVRLPDNLYSPDQMGIIMFELRTTINSLRDVSVRQKVTGKADATGPLPLSAMLSNTLAESNISPADVAALEELLDGLETIREKAPVAHLILTILPAPAFKQRLVKWFRSEVNPYTLVSFTVRSDIGGGVILRAGSHIYDFSFRARILNNKTRVAEIFHSVR